MCLTALLRKFGGVIKRLLFKRDGNEIRRRVNTTNSLIEKWNMRTDDFLNDLVIHALANFTLSSQIPLNASIEKTRYYRSNVMPQLDEQVVRRNIDAFYSEHKTIFDAWLVYHKQFPMAYGLLTDRQSKETFVAAIAARMFWHILQMPIVNSADLLPSVSKIMESKVNSKAEYDGNPLFDLKELGYDIRLYSDPGTIHLDYVLQQYCYRNSVSSISPEPRDYVIDGGASTGDVSLFFSYFVGDSGRVFSFEFTPKNTAIFTKNMDLNPLLKQRITLETKALWSSTGNELRYDEAGAATAVSSDTGTSVVTTTTIDHFVSENAIDKVDMIKLDVEGAEVAALEGAAETIRKFKPKLAVCLYHDNAHFAQIPLLVKGLNPNYKLYVRHLTSNLGETVLYAKH